MSLKTTWCSRDIVRKVDALKLGGGGIETCTEANQNVDRPRNDDSRLQLLSLRRRSHPGVSEIYLEQSVLSWIRSHLHHFCQYYGWRHSNLLSRVMDMVRLQPGPHNEHRGSKRRTLMRRRLNFCQNMCLKTTS
ncbi:Protein of unknown function [Pyronema omphalodes CBS 100304]|uniref:Uncharacterized protein n=1 Tax=Pyronema omphalodes (strain CBS 100304) TaxID=1076935 RepID=U4L362_PYROM|nr:Protein of unknown function [Pyronema omphalodes CBS 100304]